MRSRDEASSASANELRRVGPRAHAPRRPREVRPAAPVPILELDDAPVLESVAAPELSKGGSRLRGILVGVDAAAAALGWVLAVGVPALIEGVSATTAAQLAIVIGVGWLVTMFMIVSQGLYRSRVCAVRAVETARLGRAAAVSSVAALLLASAANVTFGLGEAIAAAIVTWFLLSLFRGLYTAWLRRARAADRFCRPVVVIGTGDEGYELHRLVELHPELGLRVAGVVGPRHTLARWDGEVEWLGDIAEAATAVHDAAANGVIVAVSDLGTEELNFLTRALLADGIHVQLSSGLRGVDQRRLRSQPLAHEPLFYL
jgi:FlaA1/EpsC-like NDP-sugar epimerase